jgi:putative Mn2+ efflux pump MntP
MKKRFSTNGYLRTILLSILAACIIEAIVNADEVKAAFAKGREVQKATRALKESSTDVFKVPQVISGVIGKVYYALFK